MLIFPEIAQERLTGDTAFLWLDEKILVLATVDHAQGIKAAISDDEEERVMV